MLSVTGVIRSSGLQSDDRKNLQLSSIEYQISNINGEKENGIKGYYLLTDKIDESYLGQCVRVNGIIPDKWKKNPGEIAYRISLLEVSTLEKINSLECDPYPQTDYSFDDTAQKITFQGIITHEKRPAPDIWYDYTLWLSKPFIDESSETGSPQEKSSLYAKPSSNSVWIDIENHLNQEITVEGYLRWGYAESKYFEITGIKPL